MLNTALMLGLMLDIVRKVKDGGLIPCTVLSLWFSSRLNMIYECGVGGWRLRNLISQDYSVAE